MDLFEDLKNTLGVEYIQDIKWANLNTLAIALNKLRENEYPTTQWIDLIYYVMNIAPK